MSDIKRIKDQLEKKNQERSKLQGQKEMLLESLKELGFSTTKEAEKEITKLSTKIEKMKAKYQEGVEIFIKKYKDLLDT
jgi:regulator of replication initiation timing